MSKHTPGPWATDAHEHDEPYMDITIHAKHRRKICSICIDDAPVPDYNAEQRANAKLIAAAPELLNSLEDFVKACKIPGEPKLGVEVEMAFRQADALLERLKGKV